jgi:hypothetical protein
LSRSTLFKAVAAMAVVAVIAVGLAVVKTRVRHRPGPAARSAVTVGTTPVIKTNLSDSQTLPGTLGFGAQTPVFGRGQGTVTRLPTAGRVTERGRSLYRINDQPVPVFYGATPLFRTLRRPVVPKVPSPPRTPNPGSTRNSGSTGNSGSTRNPGSTTGADPLPTSASTPKARVTPPPLRGNDVTVVAENLRALGYEIGSQPRGSGSYTAALAAAVKRWQRDTGMTATGTLGVGQVVVLPGPSRVNSIDAHLGDAAEEQLLSVTPTTKIISVPVDAGGLNGIAVGARATVVLPDSKEIRGTVASIGRTIPTGQGQGSTDENSAPALIVRVRPSRAADVAGLDAAPVQVRFGSGLRRGVLAVPVSALLALSGGGYALQRADGSLIAVRTGLFADGLVEVSGTGLKAGLPVQTAS